MVHQDMSSREQEVLQEFQSALPTDNHLDRCVICLEEVSQVGVAIPCGHHSFDFICLASWLQERSSCPLCKREVRSVEYDRQSSTDFSIYAVESVPPVPSIPPPHRWTPASFNSSFRPHRHRPARSTPTPNAALLRRKHVYQHQQYSLHIGSNPHSRYREFTPTTFSQSSDLISRAKSWIRRELGVFDFLFSTSHGAGTGNSSSQHSDYARPDRRSANAEFLLEYIIAILKTVDTRGSGGQAEEMLQEFLGRTDARLFLHELRQWLRSPYLSLEAWDRHTQYPDERGRRTEQRRDCERNERYCQVAVMKENEGEEGETNVEEENGKEEKKEKKEKSQTERDEQKHDEQEQQWPSTQRKRSRAMFYHQDQNTAEDSSQVPTPSKRQRHFPPAD